MLVEAIRGLDFDVYLGLMDYNRYGPAEGGYRDDYSLMDDCCEESCKLHSLVNANGKRVKTEIKVTKEGNYKQNMSH